MEEIFWKTNPSQLASLDGEKLLVLFQVIDTMSSKEIFLDFIHWNYEKINIILKSNYSIYTIIWSLDEQLVIFWNRPVRSYIYVDYFISELQNLKTFHGSLKENPFLKALREPTSDIPLLVREYSKNFWLDTSKFDIEALKDALMEDSEMTLLNIWFFCRKTNLKRSQFPDWQSFMLAEVRERSKETKTIIMKEIRKSSILSEKEIEEAVRKIKETQTVTVNLKKDGIEGFLKTGELKSTWEFNGMNGIWSGKLYMQNRDQVESIYGVATRLDEKFMEHPISWALVTEKSLQDKDMLWWAWNRNYEHYWRNYIKLRKESIVWRTVFTTGNTMAPYNFQEIVTNKGLEKKWELLSHAQIDHETAAYAKYLQLEHKLEFWKNGSNDYIEALILGSVKIGDIEGIYISTESICTELRAKFPQYSHLILHMPN